MPVMQLRGPEKMDIQVDRRGFLGFLTRAFLWFSGAAGVVGMVRFLSYEKGPAPTSVYTLEFPAAYPVGSTALIQDAQVILVHDQAGFYAQSLICPHLGCVIEKSEGSYQCPCHGSRFGKWGEFISGPADESLKSVWLEVDEEGRLVVDVAVEVPGEWRLIL
jgi:Rieske Fe-S protein